MSKISLNNLANLQNENTAVSVINANNSTLVTAMDNTLSRNGTPPNQMGASLDMNSNQIINLPSPTSPHSPVRLVDISSTLIPTPAILSGNNVYTGINTFTNTTTIPFTQTGTGAVVRTVDSKLKDQYFTVTDFGAVGNGSNDDTTAIQNTINAATTVGGVCYFPPGTYLITSTLNVTSHCVLMGTGYNSYNMYAANVTDTRTSGFRTSVIMCNNSATNMLNCTGHDTVHIEKLHFTYPNFSLSNSGIAIAITGSVAGSGVSYGTTIRDCYINQAGVGIQAFDTVSSVIDNVSFTFCIAPIVMKYNSTIGFSGLTNSASTGDSTIINCSFFDTSGTNAILILSGSGFRIMNNKINGGASGTFQNGIQISPQDLGIPFSMTPGLICNNSIEGVIIGVLFAPNATSQGSLSGWCITGNEFFCNQGVVLNSGLAIPQWIGAVSIVGNTFLYDFNSTSNAAVSIAGSDYVCVTGNVFTSNSPTPAQAIFFGISNGTHNRVSSNVYSGNGLPPVSSVAPAVPATGVPATNTSGFNVEVDIYGGTLTAVSVILNNGPNLVQIANGTGVTAHLSPGEQINITYSVAPTWVWRVINP